MDEYGDEVFVLRLIDRIEEAGWDVGGKNASLGEMIRALHEEGIRVPDEG